MPLHALHGQLDIANIQIWGTFSSFFSCVTSVLAEPIRSSLIQLPARESKS